jgi:hypothetical protein
MSQGCGCYSRKFSFNDLNGPSGKEGPGHTPKQHHTVPPLQAHKPQSFLKDKTHKSFSAVRPHRPHNSSPHLAEQHQPISTTSTLHHRRLQSGHTVLLIIPVYTATLTDMPSHLTTCHAHGSTWQCSKVTPNRRYAHPSPKRGRSLHGRSTGS